MSECAGQSSGAEERPPTTTAKARAGSPALGRLCWGAGEAVDISALSAWGHGACRVRLAASQLDISPGFWMTTPDTPLDGCFPAQALHFSAIGEQGMRTVFLSTLGNVGGHSRPFL
jgi:hypothetical protein